MVRTSFTSTDDIYDHYAGTDKDNDWLYCEECGEELSWEHDIETVRIYCKVCN